MAAIRSVEEIARKWATVTPLRTGDYEAGVKSPQKDWKESTAASGDAWKAGVSEAIAEGRFVKGVVKAGTGKWQLGATTKGVARWGPGVQLGEPAYGTGFAPYREAISRLTLPPKFARRDPRNLLRVKAVVDAMIGVKKAQG